MTDTDPAFDLNAIMSLDPLDLSKRDLDGIIAYQRKQRAQREAGGKTKKATGEAPKIDIKALMQQVAKPAQAKISLKDALNTSIKDGVKPATPAKGGFVRRF